MFEGLIQIVSGLFVTVVGGWILLYAWETKSYLIMLVVVSVLIVLLLLLCIWYRHKKKEKLKKEQTTNESTQKQKFLTLLPEKFIVFFGRKKEQKEIKTKLQKQNSPILLTVGIGGIGKTELAKEFFFENQNEYDKLAWINYTNTIEDSFCTSFKLFEDIKDVNIRYQAIIDYLSRLEGQNLLVIDDIDREDNGITKLTATLPNFKIIGTSRLRLNGFEKIDINVLKEKDAIKLFSKHYGNYDNKISESELEDLKKLLKLIASHTITIELVAKTAKIQGKSIKELLGSLREEGLGFAEDVTTLAYATEKEQTTINKILSKIFDISKLDDNEISLLKQLTVLPKNFDIKISFLKQFIKVTDKADLSMVLHNLEQKGWIRKDIKTINIHPVIGDTLLKKLKVKFEDIDHIASFINKTIFDQVAKNPIPAKQYIIYAEAILEIFKEEKNDKIATLLNNLSQVYKALGDLNKALEYGLKDLKISEQILDKNHPSLAISYGTLSLIYKALGELSKALEYGKKTNDIFEKILDKNHPDLATSYNNLSNIYKDLGELNKALEYGKKALRIREQILDKNHPDLAISYDNLSLIYQDLGELNKALEYGKKANDIFEKILEKNHPSLAISYGNLSSIYKALGQLSEALEYGKKANDIFEKILDKNHPHLAISYDNLSMIYQDLSDLNKALEYGEKALRIREKILDKNHPHLATSYNNLASLYYDLKDKPSALLYIKKAIDIWQKIFPNGHPNLDNSKRWLEDIQKM